jgi:hypothetical protein
MPQHNMQMDVVTNIEFSPEVKGNQTRRPACARRGQQQKR